MIVQNLSERFSYNQRVVRFREQFYTVLFRVIILLDLSTGRRTPECIVEKRRERESGLPFLKRLPAVVDAIDLARYRSLFSTGKTEHRSWQTLRRRQ